MTVAPDFEKVHAGIMAVSCAFLLIWASLAIWSRRIHTRQYVVPVWASRMIACLGIAYVIACILFAIG